MPLNWYAGMWRTCIVLWLAGLVVAGGLLGWISSFHRPFENLCAGDAGYLYDPCLELPNDVAARSEALDDLLGGVAYEGSLNLRERRQYVDPSRELPRWRTAAYRTNAAIFAVYAAAWSAAVWGLFYIGAWIAAGFKRPR